MSEAGIEPVELVRRDGRAVATMTRSYESQPAEVWAALTDPGVRVNWLAPGDVELRLGGRARLDFADSGLVIDRVVSAYVEGRVLEFSWGSQLDPPRPVTFEVSADGDGRSLLTLILNMPTQDDVGRSCAGWSAHLEMLAAALAGVPIKFPFERFKAARDAYREMFGNVAPPSTPVA